MVPVAMEGVADEIDRGELGIGDFDAMVGADANHPALAWMS